MQSYELVHKGKSKYSVLVIEEEGIPWYYDIMKFLELVVYPDGADKREHHSIRMMAMQYILCGRQLYMRSYDGIHLRCLKKEEAKMVMEEVHQGIYGPHMNGRMLAKKILRLGYFWNIMETNCVDFVKICHDCQTYANLNHVPSSELYSLTSPWTFSIWGKDAIGKIASKVSNRHGYILVSIDYFNKWVEAASDSVLKGKHMARFVKNIICQYGVP